MERERLTAARDALPCADGAWRTTSPAVAVPSVWDTGEARAPAWAPPGVDVRTGPRWRRGGVGVDSVEADGPQRVDVRFYDAVADAPRAAYVSSSV